MTETQSSLPEQLFPQQVLDAIGDVLSSLMKKSKRSYFLPARSSPGAAFTVLDAGFDREQQTCWVRMWCFTNLLARSPAILQLHLRLMPLRAPDSLD